MKAAVGLIFTGALLSSIAGCSSDRLNQDPEAMLAQTEEAAAHPSGHLDAASAKKVFGGATSATTAASVSPLGGGFPGSGSQGLGGGASCISRSGDIVEVDVACATGGKGSGTVRMKAQQSGQTLTGIVDYQNVCVTEGVSICLDGTMALKMTGTQGAGSFKMELAASFDVSGAITEHLEYGFIETVNGQNTSVQWVGYDDVGHSFVLNASVGGGKGDISVTDADGTYTCSYTNGGGTGECTGPKGKVTW
jgi:hypothetical protein